MEWDTGDGSQTRGRLKSEIDINTHTQLSFPYQGLCPLLEASKHTGF